MVDSLSAPSPYRRDISASGRLPCSLAAQAQSESWLWRLVFFPLPQHWHRRGFPPPWTLARTSQFQFQLYQNRLPAHVVARPSLSDDFCTIARLCSGCMLSTPERRPV